MDRFVRLYIRGNCPLCDEAVALLRELPLEVQEVDVDKDVVLRQLFASHVPVVDFGNNVRLYWPFTREDVQIALQRVRDMASDELDTRRHCVARSRQTGMKVERMIHWFARHWLGFIACVLGVYAGLPMLGPILMAAGLTLPANLIYTLYRLFCHQFPSRSSFLFGHQICYCDRCLGIYTSLFFATLAFGLVRQHLRPLPWQIYPIFVIPMAIDALTQIIGLRYSSFELRVITGSLFGIGSAWLVLPYLEQGFRDVAAVLFQKLALS